jgi:hypothetical protein
MHLLCRVQGHCYDHYFRRFKSNFLRKKFRFSSKINLMFVFVASTFRLSPLIIRGARSGQLWHFVLCQERSLCQFGRGRLLWHPLMICTFSCFLFLRRRLYFESKSPLFFSIFSNKNIYKIIKLTPGQGDSTNALLKLPQM